MVKCFKKTSLKSIITAQIKLMYYNFKKTVELYNRIDKVILYNDSKF